MRKLRFALCALIGVLMSWTASVAAAADLIYGAGVPVTTFDPHFYNATGNQAAHSHVFEPLIRRDASLQLAPALAIEWKAVSDTIWEFKLRRGVSWHDGKPFRAADVKFTLERVPNVPNSPGGFAGYIKDVASVEIVDDYTVRMHTTRPSPLLPAELGSVFIVSEHAGKGASTDDYNNGRAAIGTGPYKFGKFQVGNELVLVRNSDWWGGAVAWDRLIYRFIPNATARTAALLSGDVDIIDQVPAPDLARLRNEKNIAITEAKGVQLIFLNFNLSNPASLPHATASDGSPLSRNPLTDRLVRKALSLAIDREAIVRAVMDGTASATGQWVPAGLTGYDPQNIAPRPDREAAKFLLAQAGYPNGFKLTLLTPNDRYPNDSRIAQAVAQMWTRIGVTTSVDAVPFSVFSGRLPKQDFAMHLLGWGAITGNPASHMSQLFSTYNEANNMGLTNRGKYSNPEFDALVAKTLSTIDDSARETFFIEASRMAVDDVAYIPLFFINNFWASKKSIVHEPRADTFSIFSNTIPAR
jgi:peptide/nickel transport system substrate-binding protein